ncbi:hypothetical protein EMGBS3_14510 [Anaerolineaceae bacterium]|nr:hypothetical protein EMGBS3_14510 [Anaerolineaceae bacterium]
MCGRVVRIHYASAVNKKVEAANLRANSAAEFRDASGDMHIVRIGSYRTATQLIQLICKVLELGQAPAQQRDNVTLIVQLARKRSAHA